MNFSLYKVITFLIFINFSLSSVFSVEIIQSQNDMEAAAHKANTEEHLELLINEYPDSFDLRPLEKCAHIKRLDIHLYPRFFLIKNFTSFLLSLPELKNLESLNVSHLNLVPNQEEIDILFHKLANFPALRSLDLSENYFITPGTKNHVQNLILLQGLEELKIGGSFFSGAGPWEQHFQFLHEMPALRKLEMQKTQSLKSELLAFLLSVPHLESLNIADSAYSRTIEFYSRTPIDLLGGPYPHIQSLNMQGINIQSLNFADWTPNLKTLDLSDTDLTPFSMLELFRLTKLEELVLSDVKLNEENLELLSYGHFENLKLLNVSYDSVKSLPFDIMAPQLKKLDLGYTNITNGDVKTIARLNQLEDLNLEGTKISGPSLKHLSTVKSLKKLNLNATGLRDVDYSLLIACSELEELSLCKIHLTLKDLQSLSQLKQLKKLDLREVKNNNITPEMIHQLRQQLSNCTIYI